jgi:hypothetical protein
MMDNIRDNGYDQHNSFLGPRDAPLSPDVNLGPAVTTNTGAPTPEFPPATEIQADTLLEIDDPFELPQQDTSANPEVIFQVAPTTELPEEQVELPMSTRRAKGQEEKSELLIASETSFY